MENETNPWNEMANQWVNTWTQSGNDIWKNWFDLMSGSGVSETDKNGQSHSGGITEQMAKNQASLMRFLQFSFEAWKDILPKVEAGTNWEQTLENYSQQIRQQMEQYMSVPTKMTGSGSTMGKLYMEQMQKFNQMWMNYSGAAMVPMVEAMMGKSEAFIELNNLYWEQLYQPSLGNLLQSPMFGITRELNSTLMSHFQAWTNFYRASNDYQVVLADIQVRAFEKLIEKLAAGVSKGEKVETWRQFQQLWSVAIDDVFEETFCSEDKLKIRGRFINSLNAYRLEQQKLMEISMRSLNLPLRSEIDEMHKTIYQLRKEVKSLKKQISTITASSPKPESIPEVS
ncbi:MAG: class III poly(R)-hydroxyalkanoic acid synthase subunit PhaE [Arthrospira sp. PLM2.Bin9]|nr:class III poly(R)-hydroxyalkanoic acid synthase subunit PhaE [Arthrospira sp. PLM2.Bin9]TVU52821.1 MAG: class III poly(R)-hydroxyalkanoic acid synthase subunit PhaE [Arthrospira sp. PLM2.Bin9]